MDVLLTNDDGYQAGEMAAIRDAMINAGLNVLSVAPDGPRSGTSRSASFRKPVVMTRHSDPRTGETTYKLTNINRTEPAKSLFEVPSDYTIKEGPHGPLPQRMRKLANPE